MHFSRRTATTIITAVAAVFVLGYVPNTAYAASPVESITLSPTSKTYKVDAGQSFDDSLTVINDGQIAYDFTVYAAPYSVTNSSYNPNFTDTTPNADAYTWVQFKQTSWHAEPRQTIKIPYTVHVRGNAIPGGHYGVLFAEVQPTGVTSSDSTLARKKRVGAIIYATVNGDVHLSGSVVNMNIPWFQSSASLRATSSIQNTGNSDFIAKVAYKISDIFGNVKYTADNEYTVLPSTTRDITLNWAGVPWFGMYKAQIATTFLDKTVTAESFVLIMPIWLLLLLGVVIVSGVIYAIWRRTNRQY